MLFAIDGKQIEAEIGETVLTAARRAGVDIPTLCCFEDIVNISCLVCLVKVGGKFVPACATKATEGMSIESETDEVSTMRRSALELLLSDHSETCRNCGDARKTCQLLKYTAKYKADRKKWRAEIEELEMDASVLFDQRCIKCGICVAQRPELAFMYRGFNLRVRNAETGGIPDAANVSCPTAALPYS